jgi:hypothetical protein
LKKFIIAIPVFLFTAYVAALVIPYDPDEQRAGTRLSGDFAENQDPDWADWQDRRKLYLQTRTLYLIPHSITVVGWIRNGGLYVGCGHCATKYWPKNVEQDNSVILRIDGELYRRLAFKLSDEERRVAMDLDESEPLPDVAVFRMQAQQK